MDFNQAFMAYDTVDGANCQTGFGRRMTQREAALESVRKIGLNQIRDVEKDIFAQLPQYYGMFQKRMEILRTEGEIKNVRT